MKKPKMYMEIKADVVLMFDAKNDMTETQVREAIQDALNAACTFLETSPVRDQTRPRGVEYLLRVKGV